ncbi:MAG: sugar ABC transporter permease [Propionibacteriaceae bacterium]|jgi:multiple sugar transport system permease protein|nr:sugar ABC transporter permease [Propionibacteriaceae bacterium]
MTTAVARAAVRRMGAKNRNAGIAFASPLALVTLVFFVVPILLVCYMSGTDWKLLGGNKGWNFPDNYLTVVEHRMFWPAVAFTVKYTVIATILLIVIGLGLALLVQESSRWKGLLRTAILLPAATGLASASLLFYALYSPQVGPFKEFLSSIGIASILGSPDGALWATVFLIVWRYSGFYMLLLLVGLQAISMDLYEAARVDGASTLQIFSRITVPLLRPSLALSTIMCVTGSLLAFDQFYILTKGGPDGSTMTVVQLVYNLAFESKRSLGLAAALSVIALLALVVVNIFQLRVLRGGDEDE